MFRVFFYVNVLSYVSLIVVNLLKFVISQLFCWSPYKMSERKVLNVSINTIIFVIVTLSTPYIVYACIGWVHTMLYVFRNIILRTSTRRRSHVWNWPKTDNIQFVLWLLSTCDAKLAASIYTRGKSSMHGKRMSRTRTTWGSGFIGFILKWVDIGLKFWSNGEKSVI